MGRARKVIVTCMRNEALFVVEWLAHHVACGFDRIVVFTNDCDDGTDLLLDALAAGGAPVERHDNPGPYSAGSIQKQALYRSYRLPVVATSRWVLHIDADEYLNVTCGRRRIDDLLAQFPDADGIALMWRHFGDGGVERWEGGSVLRQFTRCEADLPDPALGQLAGFKTIFRPRKFRGISVHNPKRPRRGRPVSIVNTAGEEMPLDSVLNRRGSGYTVPAELCTWENACLHHHHVKSEDLHRMKHARGDANGRKNTKREIGSEFYHQTNRNDIRNMALARFSRRVEPIAARYRAMPGVAEIEARAMALFRARWQDDLVPSVSESVSV